MRATVVRIPDRAPVSDRRHARDSAGALQYLWEDEEVYGGDTEREIPWDAFEHQKADTDGDRGTGQGDSVANERTLKRGHCGVGRVFGQPPMSADD